MTTLIKNAYTPGQWYVFFYEAKNVEQAGYYNNVDRQFSSWYSFLQKDQVQGKVFDFLGVPNYCGKINKKQLRKIYQNENSKRKRFDKLDVQVNRIQLTDNPHSSTKTFRFFQSKNALNGSDTNSKLENSTTRIEPPSLDKRRNIEGKCGVSKNYYKLQSTVQLDSRQNNVIRIDDSSSNSDNALLSQSDEDIFVECNRKVKEPRSARVFKPPINNQTDRNRSVATKISRSLGDSETLKKTETSDAQSPYAGVVPGITSFNQPSAVLTTLPKKKVEFKNVDEYFFFKDNSSASHSSQTDDVNVQEAKTAVINDNSSNDDDNAFDTGFLSPVQDFCSSSPVQSQETFSPYKATASRTSAEVYSGSSPTVVDVDGSSNNDNAGDTEFLSPVQDFNSASPQQSQEMFSSYEPTVSRASAKVHSGSSPTVVDDDGSSNNDNACDTGFLSPVQDFNSASPQQSQEMFSSYEPTASKTPAKIHSGSSPTVVNDDDSSDNDNACDTGFLSPVQDFCPESPIQIKNKASSHKPISTEASHNNNKPCLLMTENEESWKPNDNDFSTSGFLSSPVHKWDNTDIRSNAVGKESATLHSSNVSKTNSESEFFVDRRISHPLSLKSTDDEALSQTSAMTELFATSITVDLRIPGALQYVNDEYKRLFDTLSYQQPFLGTGKPSQIFNIAAVNSAISRSGNGSNQTPDSYIESNTILRGQRHTFSLTNNSNCGSITINNQEEHMEIRKLNLNSIENSTPNLDYDTSKIVERLNIFNRPLEMNSTCDTKSQKDQSSYPQPNSMQTNSNSLEYMDDPVVNPINRKEELNSANDKVDNPPEASPSSKIEKRATPLGKRRLPLKKRSLSKTPKSPCGNAEVSRKQSSTENKIDIDEARLPAANKIVDKMLLDDTAGSMETQDRFGLLQGSHNENKIKDIAVEGCKPVEDAPQEVHLGIMKTKKHIVDLAWKLSLRHNSELFFNDPDIATKFREGSLSCSAASRETSSKSTHPRKNMNEEPQAESNLTPSVAQGFEEMDLNPPDNLITEDGNKYSIEQAVTPIAVSTPFTKNGSPLPRSAVHSGSEINLDSPFVEDFLMNTQSFHDNARASQIYDMETPSRRAALGLSQTSMNIPASLDTECRSVNSSIVDRHANFIDESVKSVRLPMATSPSVVSQWWKNENITPLRKTLSANSSPGSGDSLRVLLPTSQRKTRKPSTVDAANFAYCDFSKLFSLKNSNQRLRSNAGSNKDFGHSKIDRPNVKPLDGVKSSEKIGENLETERLKSVVVPRENAVQGKRMSFVFSNVITKPVGSERQSNDHDFLICEDENSTTFSLLQDE